MELQWPLILFTALTGTAGWMFACLAVDEAKGVSKNVNSRFVIALVALIVLAVGGLASVLHLSHPERMMGALGHPTSGIFVEATLVALAGVCAIVYLILAKRASQSAGARKAFAVLAAVFGVLLSFMAGESYMMGSQPAWNTVLMPLGYLGTAIPAGIGAYMLVMAGQKEDVSFFNKFLLVGGIVGAVLALAFGCVSGFAGSGMLYCAIAVIGAAVAAIVGFMLDRKSTPAAVEGDSEGDAVAANSATGLVTVALICAFVGAVCYRCLMWATGVGINNFFGQM